MKAMTIVDDFHRMNNGSSLPDHFKIDISRYVPRGDQRTPADRLADDQRSFAVGTALGIACN
jgi:hypothetical protein